MKRFVRAAFYAVYLLAVAGLIVAWWAVMAQAQTYYPSAPVVVVGPQGRPIPNGTFSVANTVGIQQTVYADAAGATVAASPSANGRVPSQPIPILQFFATPGTYVVTVSGEGVTRQYWTTVTAPQASTTPAASNIWVNFRAQDMTNQLSSSPALTCPPAGTPCYYEFAGGTGSEQYVMFDFVVAPFALSHILSQLEWGPATTGVGLVRWRVTWCAYAEGSPVCTPVFSGGNLAAATSTTTSVVDDRIDVDFTSTDWATNWPADIHVVVQINRHRAATGGQNSYPGGARLKAFNMEFQR